MLENYGTVNTQKKQYKRMEMTSLYPLYFIDNIVYRALHWSIEILSKLRRM